MQPDLLSVRHEEEKPELLSAQNMAQSESISISGIAQPKSNPLGKAANPVPPSTAGKKRSRLNIATLGLALLVFLLLLSFAWVGYWTYTLSTELTATQQQLTTLQAEHAKLQTDYATLVSEKEKLNADLTQAKSDLEKANTDLTTTQSDLRTSQDQNEELNSQIDSASKLAEILYLWSTTDNPSDVFKIDTLVNETYDQQLIKQWNNFTESPSEDTLGMFMEYLILTTRNSLR